MIEINGRKYKLLLVDTNILSEVLKNKSNEFRKFLEITNKENAFICFSVFTILEIRRVSKIYEQFLEMFSNIPCIILKSHEQLLQDEVAVYPNFSNVEPLLVGFPGPFAKAKLKDVLIQFFNQKQAQLDEQKWILGQNEVVSGIKSLVENFPPENGKYTKQKIREFIQLAGFQQIALRQSAFAKSIIESNKAVDIDAFPSIKMTAFVVFYKFYIDRTYAKLSD